MEHKEKLGGLLGNVSLLTTGGSSLQHQLTNDDLRLTSNQGHSTLQNISEIPNAKKGGATMETSTPARPMMNTNVMYGFDLSPVHSYEVPVSTNSGKTTYRSQHVDGDNNHSITLTEDSIKAEQILDQHFDSKKGNAAPNFMQAPLVPSPHQSRIGAISELEENTETMMSQVYSSNRSEKTKFNSPKPRGHSSRNKPKKLSSDSSRARTPNSPRKTSKHYSNIKSSGYGVGNLSTSKSTRKSKQSLTELDETGKTKKTRLTTSEKQTTSREKFSKFPTQSSGPTKVTNNRITTKPPVNKFGETHTIQSLETFQRGRFLEDNEDFDSNQNNIVIGTRSPPNNYSLHQSQIKYRDLEDKYNALEVECGKMKMENSEVTKQNFLLSAKLNHLIEDVDKSDEVKETPGGTDLSPQEKEIMNLKKEIIELERLMKGYQQENEKMYQKIAKTKQTNQENELAMYNENLRLKTQIANLQEENKNNEAIIKDKNYEINKYKVNGKNLRQQNEPILVKETNCREHEQIIQDLREKLSSVMSQQESKGRQVCGELERLKISEEEISLLKAQVHKMKKELLAKNQSKKESEMVTDLRRQVKELESIATKYQSKDEVKFLIHGHPGAKKLLEERCEKLEIKLKEQEEESGENIRALQKLYNKMRVDYETHVSKLAEEVDLMKIQTRKQKSDQNEIKGNFILMESLENENKNLKNEMKNMRFDTQSLKTENEKLVLLLKEFKLNKENISPLIKRKSRGKGIEPKSRVYHPEYFDNSRENGFKPEDPLRISIERKNVKELDFNKDVLKWKKLHNETKLELESLKIKQNEQIASINDANQKTMEILEKRLANAEKNFCESESKKFSIEAEKSTSQAREKALQQQIKYLLDELQETRMGSPIAAVRRIEALQSRLGVIDMRQRAREEKLDQALVKNADSYLKEEIETLHATIAEKNNLLVKFRYELDSMLLALEKLQTTT